MKKLEEEIKTYFAERYMKQWLTFFAAAKNRKETWALARDIGTEKDSLSNFYNRRKAGSMNEYIGDLARYDNMQKIMQVLNIDDSVLKFRVEKAMGLKKADYSRLVNEWYSNH